MPTISYYLRFGSDAPANHSGLSPTFISFRNATGGATTAPGITEVSTTGIYTFAYEPFGSINFVADGNTTGLGSSDRYITGALDTIDLTYVQGTTTQFYAAQAVVLGTQNVGLGETNIALNTIGNALGTTAVALGTTAVALGTTSVAIGTTILGQLAFGTTLSFLIGNTSSLIGDSVSSPTTVFGFIMRTRQWLEGDSIYTKATGVLQNYDNTGATLLSQVTIADAGSTVTRS